MQSEAGVQERLPKSFDLPSNSKSASLPLLKLALVAAKHLGPLNISPELTKKPKLRIEDNRTFRSSPGQRFAQVLSYERHLLSILNSSPGALLVNQHSRPIFESLGLLKADLEDRLSFDWVLPIKPANRLIAIVGGQYRFNMKHRSFSHRGTFDAARALGISIIVLDHPGHLAPRRQIFLSEGHFITLDMTNDAALPLRIFESSHEKKLDGIVTFSDNYLVATAEGAELLHLPSEPALAYHQAHDKYLTHQSLSVSQSSQSLDHPDDLNNHFVCKTWRLCIIKPRQGSGSRGVRRANNEFNLRQAVRQLQKDGLSNHGILVEEYISGPDVDANFVLLDGQLCFCEITDDFPCQADGKSASVSDSHGLA